MKLLQQIAAPVLDGLRQMLDADALRADKVAGLDINPLLVYPEGEGVLAVDALIELQ